jgi:hypothetical protein
MDGSRGRTQQRASEDIGADDVVLILLHECGEVVTGKTILQKLGYFLTFKEGIDLGFSPHFYGPFSRELEQDVELLVLSGLTEEQTTSLGTTREGLPIGNTRYALTPKGAERAMKVAEAFPQMAEDARALGRSLQARGTVNPRAVSVAAKVHFIARTKQLPLTREEIAHQANELGWQVQPNEVNFAVELLRDLS